MSQFAYPLYDAFPQSWSLWFVPQLTVTKAMPLPFHGLLLPFLPLALFLAMPRPHSETELVLILSLLIFHVISSIRSPFRDIHVPVPPFALPHVLSLLMFGCCLSLPPKATPLCASLFLQGIHFWFTALYSWIWVLQLRWVWQWLEDTFSLLPIVNASILLLSRFHYRFQKAISSVPRAISPFLHWPAYVARMHFDSACLSHFIALPHLPWVVYSADPAASPALLDWPIRIKARPFLEVSWSYRFRECDSCHWDLVPIARLFWCFPLLAESFLCLSLPIVRSGSIFS